VSAQPDYSHIAQCYESHPASVPGARPHNYCINGAELDTPETDCLSADGDASFSEEIFDIPMAEIETTIEPDSVRNDIGRKSVTFICIHRRIVSISVI
jgi:hypothetical protein